MKWIVGTGIGIVGPLLGAGLALPDLRAVERAVRPGQAVE